MDIMNKHYVNYWCHNKFSQTLLLVLSTSAGRNYWPHFFFFLQDFFAGKNSRNFNVLILPLTRHITEYFFMNEWMRSHSVTISNVPFPLMWLFLSFSHYFVRLRMYFWNSHIFSRSKGKIPSEVIRMTYYRFQPLTVFGCVLHSFAIQLLQSCPTLYFNWSQQLCVAPQYLCSMSSYL